MEAHSWCYLFPLGGYYCFVMDGLDLEMLMRGAFFSFCTDGWVL